MNNSKGLNDFFDIKILKEIQDKLGEISGVAFNIVDYKGNPINEYSHFSSFCKKMRSTEEGYSICAKTNAHAGFEAALIQKPFIFKCPAGLTDAAIPIVIDNSYLGAVFLGQVRTFNHSLLPVQYSRMESNFFMNHLDIKKEFEEINIVEFSKIEALASFVDIIVKQLIDKSSLDSLKEELAYLNIKLEKERESKKKVEQKIWKKELNVLQLEHNPKFLYNTLNTVARLALMEEAPQTQEMIFLLTEVYRYFSKEVGEGAMIEEELKNIETYFKIQKIRFGDKLKYSIDFDENVRNEKIPEMVLIRFAEFAVMNGISLKPKGGTIHMKGFYDSNGIKIIISDNGIGMPADQLYRVLNGEQDKNDYISKSLYHANKILQYYYGNNFKLKIDSERNRGTSIEISIPLE